MDVSEVGQVIGSTTRWHLGPGTVLLAIVLVACEVVHDPETQVTPQRPTYSSSTTTTAYRTLELEAGLSVDPNDSVDTPTTWKYGAGSATELFVGWSPYRHLDREGADGHGPGDLSIGTRHRFWEETSGRPAAALQLATKLPTGSQSQGLSSGEVDFFAAGILSKDFEAISLTGFYQLGVLGEPDDSEVDLEHGLALAAGAPIVKELSAFAELAAIYDREQDFDSVFTTWGLALAVGPGLVLDAGAAFGLNHDAPDFQLLIGLTFNPGLELRSNAGAE
ncbi:MAG: transporter [Planctomycetota bacterium]